MGSWSRPLMINASRVARCAHGGIIKHESRHAGATGWYPAYPAYRASVMKVSLMLVCLLLAETPVPGRVVYVFDIPLPNTYMHLIFLFLFLDSAWLAETPNQWWLLSLIDISLPAASDTIADWISYPGEGCYISVTFHYLVRDDIRLTKTFPFWPRHLV